MISININRNGRITVKYDKGFSLIELISIIAIIVIVVGILSPNFLRYVEKSRNIADVAEMSEINDCLVSLLTAPDVSSNKYPWLDGDKHKYAYVTVFPKKLADSSGNTTKIGIDSDPDASEKLRKEMSMLINLDELRTRSKTSKLGNGYIVFLDIENGNIEYRIPKSEISCGSFTIDDAMNNVWVYDTENDTLRDI